MKHILGHRNAAGKGEEPESAASARATRAPRKPRKS